MVSEAVAQVEHPYTSHVVHRYSPSGPRAFSTLIATETADIQYQRVFPLELFFLIYKR